MDQVKIGIFIQDCRKMKKITQLELAEKLGVTDRTISNWENGKNMPDLSMFKPLCDILGITINELLSGEKILSKDYTERLEENFINIIDYVNKNNIKINNYRIIFFLILGVIGIIISNFNIGINENYLVIISMTLIIYVLKQLFISYKIARKIIGIIIVLICLISIFFI